MFYFFTASIFFVLLIAFMMIGMIMGAPLVPSKPQIVSAMLDLVNLKKGELLYDLGSGDGRVLIAAAQRGIQAKGIEINPFAVLLSLILAFFNGVGSRIGVKWGNYWSTPLSGADGVVVYGLPTIMPRLSLKLRKELKKGTPVVSNSFQIPELKLVKSVKMGFDTLYLYKV